MSTYAIGDIQGCYTELRTLLDNVAFDPAQDRLWLVGDLVNRGPNSLEVLRFVKGLGERAVVVLGNHDLHLIMRAEGYGRGNKDDTLDAVLQAPDCAELLHWLRHRPLVHVEGDFAMVHAGLLPQWSVAQAAELASEVARALRAEDFRELLANMRGSQPAAWRDELQGWDRLRVIVNAMTRMRFCTPQGDMEFHAKGKPDAAPEGYLPWFAVPQRESRTHTLLCGHWSALGLHRADNIIALDTGCLWGGQLSAVRLEDKIVFQVESLSPTP